MNSVYVPTAADGETFAKRDANLRKANEVRLAAVRIKRDLAAGRVELADALTRPELARRATYDVLLWLPGYGAMRARRVLARNQINPLRPAGNLTERQRSALVDAVAR